MHVCLFMTRIVNLYNRIKYFQHDHMFCKTIMEKLTNKKSCCWNTSPFDGDDWSQLMMSDDDEWWFKMIIVKILSKLRVMLMMIPMMMVMMMTVVLAQAMVIMMLTYNIIHDADDNYDNRSMMLVTNDNN